MRGGEGAGKTPRQGPPPGLGLGFALSPSAEASLRWRAAGGGGKGHCGSHASPHTATGLLAVANGPCFCFIFFMFLAWSMSAGRGAGEEDKLHKSRRGTLCPCPLGISNRAVALPSNHPLTVCPAVPDPPSSQMSSSLSMTRSYLLPSASLIFNLVFCSERTCANSCRWSQKRPCLWATKYDSREGA